MRKLLGVMGVLIVMIVEMVSWADPYVEIDQVTHFKCVQYMVCQLYLKKCFQKMQILDYEIRKPLRLLKLVDFAVASDNHCEILQFKLSVAIFMNQFQAYKTT